MRGIEPVTVVWPKEIGAASENPLHFQSEQSEIAVFKPRLPDTDALIPFLREIDANRWYSNRGPLLERFEAALADHFAVPAERVVAVASATAGLTLSILASGSPDRGPDGHCIMPSWTHEATAVAVVRAGLQPWLHDVGEHDWQLDPEVVAQSLSAQSLSGAGKISHVMVTAPFGATVDLSRWAALADRFGVPVTVDAASGFDRLRGGPVDAVVSLHATKVLGIGEGGVVIARDAGQAERIRTLAQLGLSPDRVVAQAGMNAKLSEYGAAVGLAAMADWPTRRNALIGLRESYAARLEARTRVGLWLPEGISSTLIARLPSPNGSEVARALADRGIATRRWWHAGCHRQPAFATVRRQPLPVTDRLAASVLGLPFHEGLDQRSVERVVDALAEFHSA